VAEDLGIAEKGYRLITNCGVAAGQTVFHLHYHLLGGVDMGPKFCKTSIDYCNNITAVII